MDETFSSIDLVGQCLLDTERTAKFRQVIEEVVDEDSIVLDAGTGSGILTLFAAEAGAKKIYSIEYDPFVAKTARQNFENNGFGDKIKILHGDARNIYLNEKVIFDVVIMEMLTTGMVDEHQVATLNNLRKSGYIDEHTVFIPMSQDTYINLAEYDFNDYGMKMRMVKHLWKFLEFKQPKLISEKTLINSIEFNKENSLKFDWTSTIEAKEDGILNSIYITSVTHINEEVEAGDTIALNGPVIFPLPSDLLLNKGDMVEIKISYTFGEGFKNFNTSARKVS